ncbi:MAG: hypothetical protein LBU88_04560 [Treponema sp.]|jgi:hypothetical protein|nr:hypothetical protein [Treponema sp.]
MKIYKKLVFALLASLTVMFILTSCPPESKPANTGYGYAVVSVGRVNLRTILPPDGTDLLDIFNSYRFTFTATGGYAQQVGYNETININKDNLGSPIPLVPGTYNLQVIAFMDSVSDGQNQSVAETPDPVSITINEGGTTTTTIRLEVYSPGSTTNGGTFSWKIDFSGITASDYTVKMEIALDDAMSTLLQDIDLLETDSDTDWDNTFDNTDEVSTGTSNLAAGYYNVTFTLEVDDLSWISKNSGAWVNANMEDPFDNGKFIFSQALWIYQYLDSEFEFDFTDESFGPQTVTFKYLEDPTPDTQAHAVLGGSVSLPSGYTKDVTNDTFGTPPARYYFAGWWTKDGRPYGGGLPGNPIDDPYNPDLEDHPEWGNLFTNTTGVLGNITVYARWVKDGESAHNFEVAPLGGNLIKLALSIDGVSTAIYNGDTITIDSTDEAELTITNIDKLENVEWIYNNELITGQYITGSDNETLVIINSGGVQPDNKPFIKGFEHIVVIKATDPDYDDALQSFWFILDLKDLP